MGWGGFTLPLRSVGGVERGEVGWGGRCGGVAAPLLRWIVIANLVPIRVSRRILPTGFGRRRRTLSLLFLPLACLACRILCPGIGGLLLRRLLRQSLSLHSSSQVRFFFLRFRASLFACSLCLSIAVRSPALALGGTRRCQTSFTTGPDPSFALNDFDFLDFGCALALSHFHTGALVVT